NERRRNPAIAHSARSTARSRTVWRMKVFASLRRLPRSISARIRQQRSSAVHPPFISLLAFVMYFRNPMFRKALTPRVRDHAEDVMTRTLTALTTAATLAVAAVAAPTTASAQFRHGGFGVAHHGFGFHRGFGFRHHGFGAGAVIGGLAAGALVGSALAAPAWGYPAYGTYAYDPDYYAYGDACTLRRERVWNGWHWVIRHVRVCY